jgi:hypothetical protein
MQGLSAALAETDCAAAEVHQSANEVGQQARRLSETVDLFLGEIAAA